MKIVSAHQPHFLPWMGYFNKILRSDIFIWLEDVQFRKNYFQNRTKIKSASGEQWLTIPVKKASLDTTIREIQIANSRDLKKIAKTIRVNYSKAGYFDTYFPIIEQILNTDYDSLSALNFDLLQEILKILEIKTEIVRLDKSPNNDDQDPNERLVDLCNKFNASHYIAGKGGGNYMEIDRFDQNEIEVIWQNFPVDTIEYDQLYESFIPGLSIIDSLFNIGQKETIKLISTPWSKS